MEFPDEAVVEDTTRLRDKLPDLTPDDEENSQNTSEKAQSETKNNIQEGSLTEPPALDSQQKPEDSSQRLTGNSQTLKTSADIRKTLDSFFDD